METVTVRLEAFEGPLDLLYHLIEKNEMDIFDIPIAALTEQFLTYLNTEGSRDMENLSAFLVMAADLLEIKSKMLLPKTPKAEEEEDVDPRDALVAKLLEYKRFKAASEVFEENRKLAEQRFFKEEDARLAELRKQVPQTMEDALSGLTMEDIFAAFQDVMQRKAGKVDHVRSGFKEVARDRFTVSDKVGLIRDLLLLHRKLKFTEIFRAQAPKAEIVVTFLALLDLMKAKEVLVSQETQFGEIVITKATQLRLEDVEEEKTHETDRTGSGD